MKHIAPSDFIAAGHAVLVNPRDAADRPGSSKLSLFGLELAIDSREAMASHIVASAASRRRVTINFINAHCINVARNNSGYRRALARTDLLLPDGIGIEIAAKMAGKDKPVNLNGTDLFPLICERAAAAGAGIFLLGGLPKVADAAAAWACGSWPTLRISGTQDGYFDRAHEDAVIERINRSGAAILFVGLGVPLQEAWIERNRHRLLVPAVLGVGGLFDYYSGRIARAPAVIREAKCEWVWRLAMEPRRMAERYLVGNAVFLAHAAIEAARQRGLTHRVSTISKRAFDIVVALMAIILLMPILLAAAAAIRLEDRGPVFFYQRRVGAGGRTFMMTKFRSMYTDAEQRRAELLAHSDRSGTCFKMQDDPRITRVGKIIRRFSIDELPQLFNVLTGAMSLVGPRPALPQEVVSYVGRQWERLGGKPGITCSWQVKGRANIPFHRQAIMDRAYLRRQSFGMDLRLLAMTLPAVISGRGAY